VETGGAVLPLGAHVTRPGAGPFLLTR
jgi:hypothetical protein